MKRASLFLGGILMVLFCLQASGERQGALQIPSMITPVLGWNAFLGGSDLDGGKGIAIDANRNIYVIGVSASAWGSPLLPFTGQFDAFVAKLDTNGNLQWNTFLGGADFDYGEDISVDASGNLYVTGSSRTTWGSPINPHMGGADAFVAKLDANGNLQWNTFLGGADTDSGYGITINTGGDCYLAGTSFAAWGSPLQPFAGDRDAFVAKLDANGCLQWNTFLGSAIGDGSSGIALDTSGNSYVIGESYATWGSPLLPFAGPEDAFVAKLDATGSLQWNTFLGGEDTDYGFGIALDTGGNCYVVGESWAAWGSPLLPFAGRYDAFVAKLDANGNLHWNTFLGGPDYDWGEGIAVDTNGNSYVTGVCNSTWGSSVNPYAGSRDAFIANLDTNGALLWNTFLGGTSDDNGRDIAVDASGNLNVIGSSGATWGTPICPYTGGADVFVAKISDRQVYSFFGFDQPIDNQPIVNNAKAGSAIPVKWRITELDGTPVYDPTNFKSLTSYGVSCGSFSGDPVDELDEYSAGNSGLRYLGDGYWQFNWKTVKSYAGQCRIMVLKLADGSEHTAYFKFK